MIQIDYAALHTHEPGPSSIIHEKQSNGISDEFGFASPAMDLGPVFFCLFVLTLLFLPVRCAHIFPQTRTRGLWIIDNSANSHHSAQIPNGKLLFAFKRMFFSKDSQPVSTMLFSQVAWGFYYSMFFVCLFFVASKSLWNSVLNVVTAHLVDVATLAKALEVMIFPSCESSTTCHASCRPVSTNSSEGPSTHVLWTHNQWRWPSGRDFQQARYYSINPDWIITSTQGKWEFR